MAPSDEQGRPTPPRDALFRVDWVAWRGAETPTVSSCAVLGTADPDLLTALTATHHQVRSFTDHVALAADRVSGAAPDLVFVALSADPATVGGLAEAARSFTIAALNLMREWVSDSRADSGRLVLVTRGAVAAVPGDAADDLVHAPLWGLVRAAQQEYPDRFSVLDLDGLDLPAATVVAALSSGEPGLAVRAGQVLVPRLAAVAPPPATALDLDPDGTVLVTGGTGALGAVVARHLVTAHGVRHLLLTSRRGPDSPGAETLRVELAELGATVTLAACDTADEEAVRRLLDGVPARRPLTAVIHAAGVVDDGVLTALTPERMDAVLRPKVDGAWHLHRLTAGLDLRAFLLFSSASGTLGAAGQANYAAANAFLDTLAHHRRVAGLAGQALAWGLWAEEGMAGGLQQADLARMARSGVLGLATRDGLTLLDAAAGTDAAALVPIRLDLAALRRRTAELPAILSALAGAPALARRRVATDTGTEADAWSRLAGLSGVELERALLTLVRATAAAVLGRDQPASIDPERGFLELGFDSLTALEFRNRLDTVTGRRLPATLIFDYRSPVELAAHLHAELVAARPTEPSGVEGPEAMAALEERLAALEAALESAAPDPAARARLGHRLRTLAAAWTATGDTTGAEAGHDIGAVSVEELFGILDEELESSA
ncbi:type I polyketide synthase [Phytohabitans kaempferiae]